jgi:hypothetical protein
VDSRQHSRQPNLSESTSAYTNPVQTNHNQPDAGHPHRRTRGLVLLINLSLVGLLLGLGAGYAIAQAGSARALHNEFQRGDQGENTLIIWAGDKAHIAPDFVTVVDFDERSPT